MSRKFLEIGLVAAVFVAAGGFGGTEPVSWGVAQTLIFLLGLLLLAIPRNPYIDRGAKLLAVPAVLALWIAVQWFESRSGKIGIDTHAIASHGLTYATCVVAFFAAFDVARERGSRKRLALCLIGLGLFEALYGLAEYLAGWQYIWNVPRRYYLGSATGTYVNHNHFAGLVEMILPLSLGLAYYHWRSARRRSRRRTLGAFVENAGQPEILKCFLLMLVSVVLLVAIVFSFSRMGMIATLASLGAMAGAVWIGRGRTSLPVALILLSLAGGAATAAWVGVGPVVAHFEQLPQNEPLVGTSEGRMVLWKDAAKLVAAHPWTGVGLGCFQYAFTRVQSTQLGYLTDHAHNDYLELAVDLGIPAGALLFGLFFWMAGRTFRASLLARSNLTRSIALGSFGGLTALLVHSAADFNLYIPANALVFAVLLGIGYAASLDENAPELNARRSG
ncbi:MAG TPA: O-antigen ligase family protein [Candidatus Acidoferrales bacterium]|nr:O-antigen ligase family protein [Candidatus Acidoferrales bacterium]